MGEIYANAQGQSLAAHSVLVARVAQRLAQQTYQLRDADNALDASLIAAMARWAGLLHDIGKLEPFFSTTYSHWFPKMAAQPTHGL